MSEDLTLSLLELSFTILAFLMSLPGFGLKRYLLQTLKAADEMGGVCYLEHGDNQHAQSSLVSALPRCLRIKNATQGSSACWRIQISVRLRKICILNIQICVCLEPASTV